MQEYVLEEPFPLIIRDVLTRDMIRRRRNDVKRFSRNYLGQQTCRQEVPLHLSDPSEVDVLIIETCTAPRRSERLQAQGSSSQPHPPIESPSGSERNMVAAWVEQSRHTSGNLSSESLLIASSANPSLIDRLVRC